jgi:hypothetical protein
MKQVAIILTVLAVVLFVGDRLMDQYAKQKECEARGGVYVRQAFGYACVRLMR